MKNAATVTKLPTKRAAKPKKPALGARVSALESQLARPRFSSRGEAAITIATGCGIPLFSLGMSVVAGKLLVGAQSGLHIGLGVASALVMCTVLAVSLSHLAFAFEQITGSSRRESWALAIAIDVGIVMCKTGAVYGEGLGLGVWPEVMLVGVTAASMVLNVYAFMAHSQRKAA